MGEADDHPSPIWRTPLAAALAAWMAGVVGATLAAPAILETAPDGTGIVILAGIFAVPPPILMVWSFWTLLNDPETGWIAPTVLMGFLGAFVPGFQPLLDAGVRMNFEARRPAYEAIIEDARAGRLRPDARGWVEDEIGGVQFRYRADRPGVVEFPWVDSSVGEAGIRHNDVACVPTRALKCLDRGKPLIGHYFFYQELR